MKSAFGIIGSMKDEKMTAEVREALQGALQYMESVKRNEKFIQEAYQHKGWQVSWLFASLDLKIERIKRVLSE